MTGALVTRKSGFDFCTVWNTPHARGMPTASQYTATRMLGDLFTVDAEELTGVSIKEKGKRTTSQAVCRTGGAVFTVTGRTNRLPMKATNSNPAIRCMVSAYTPTPFTPCATLFSRM